MFHSERRLEPDGAGRERKTIAVVEDSDEDFETIEWLLRKTGHYFELRRFWSADDVFEHLADDAVPALILLDLNLIGTDGIEALRRIKADEHWCKVPIVIMTTSNDPKDVDACYRGGASGYIQKPVNFEKFARSLQIMMDYWLEAVTPA